MSACGRSRASWWRPSPTAPDGGPTRLPSSKRPPSQPPVEPGQQHSNLLPPTCGQEAALLRRAGRLLALASGNGAGKVNAAPVHAGCCPRQERPESFPAARARRPLTSHPRPRVSSAASVLRRSWRALNRSAARAEPGCPGVGWLWSAVRAAVPARPLLATPRFPFLQVVGGRGRVVQQSRRSAG